MDVKKILSEPHRQWSLFPPATDISIEQLQSISPGPLPVEYVSLLRYSNGGEGLLNLPPLYFMLYECENVFELNKDEIQRDLYPDLFQFGSNGGLEAIAFYTRKTDHWPIVMFDPIAGVQSVVTIADNMEEFIQEIGFESVR